MLYDSNDVKLVVKKNKLQIEITTKIPDPPYK